MSASAKLQGINTLPQPASFNTWPPMPATEILKLGNYALEFVVYFGLVF